MARKLPWLVEANKLIGQHIGAGFFASVGIEQPAEGTAMIAPAVGCVVLAAGPVGVAIGQSLDGRLLVVGADADGLVAVRPVARSAVRGYRWPAGYAPGPMVLPILPDPEAAPCDELC